MSHEIRTPLNAVLGYTQLLMRDQQISGSQRERLQFILTASQRLLSLINDILDLSKIESGAMNLRQDYFDIHQEIAEIKSIIAERTQAKHLELRVQINLPSPSIVKGDRQKLGQILLNLLGNAVKFTHHGYVSLSVTRDKDTVEFLITDTGPGIAPQELEQLFAAFRQGQAGEDSGGTGLGLVLSRHLAQGMSGSLELSSQLGEGTQARLRLPWPIERLSLPDVSNHVQIAHLSEGSHCQALVVEDDQASCDVLFNLLEQIGCTTFAASNGREGLARCAEQYFDIIFTDIRMPDINGLEMLRQLRANPSYQNTPIIAVSASSLDHERTYYLTQGFQDFIGKPYSFDDIFSALIRHTKAQFETQSSVDISTREQQPETVDITPVLPALKQIQAAAASGDMSNCKKMVADLAPELVGNSRYLELLGAIKHYDLERAEELVREWMRSTT
jgi:CheY-like chemotaxis protein